ncbi:MAG: FtsX-like permease family protein, partial [bacterium]|nr:FtsX-like permease family protein [bacterium]
MRRSLTYYWQIHLAVVLGVGVATAVLTGALLVGDSVRGSLRDLSLDRLGKIDHALLSERFFRIGLVEDLQQASGFQDRFETAVPAVILGGTAVQAEAGTRASRVQIQGMDGRFADLFEADVSGLSQQGSFPSVLVNESLRKELHAQVGDPILLSFERPSDIHRESLFGRDDVSDAVQTLRLTLAGVLPDRGMGRFGLRAHQGVPFNAFVLLPVLQRALGQRDRINALLVSGGVDFGVVLQDLLSQAVILDDIGIVIRRDSDIFSVESTQFILKPHLAEQIETLAGEYGAAFLSILTYLAHTTRVGDRSFPYSTISAMDVKGFGSLQLVDGAPAPGLEENDILLNAWAAQDLNARVGDRVEVAYFGVGPKEELLTRRETFRLKGIVAMTGLGADSGLSPEYPGLQDANDMSAWDAPFPVDLRRIREKDEAYWDTYRAAPKAFVSASTGQRLWKNRFGVLTSVRIGKPSGLDVETAAERFEKGLLEKVAPESVGLVFQPVKQQGLASSSGATDFSGLFIGFSQFLIVSAALLVGLLFRLGVEQRAEEVGILMALGYLGKAIRRRFLGEAILLAGLGGVLGLGGAVGYAWLIMAGLRTRWIAAVGTSDLFLHITLSSLAMGFVISLLVVLFAIWRTVRRLGRVPVRALLSGVTDVPGSGSGRRTKWVAYGSLILAIGCLGGTFGMDALAAVGLFFGSGALLLVSGLSFLALGFRSVRWSGLRSVSGMGVRNSIRQPGRSLLCASLIGCASFMIVAVGANQRTDLKAEVALDRTSGTGGFALVAEVDVPLYDDLNSEDGRFELGFSSGDVQLLDQSQVISFRTLPGEDVSCLNLYQPETPRILGVPDALVQRGGFAFQHTWMDAENPWTLLKQDLEPDVIPAFGDFNSVRWILHKQLGDDIVLQNEAGQAVKLRLVGLLQNSIFQSELLISESNFLTHF